MVTMKKMTKRGFTLIELMIVVVIIGILASLAIYGVSQYVTNAKTAEARTAVGRIGKDALVAFEGEQMAGAVLALGGTAGVSRRLCGTSTLAPTALQAEGVKYQSAPSEWQTGDADNGWSCLKFSMDQAILFQYGFSSTSDGATATTTTAHTATAFAQANMGGQVKAIGQLMSTDADGDTVVLKLAPALSEANWTTEVTAISNTAPTF